MMTDFPALQAIADRVQIEALPGEFTDAVMMRDWDRLASLFTHDGALRIHVERVYEGRYLDTTPLAGSAPRPVPWSRRESSPVRNCRISYPFPVRGDQT